MNTELAARIKNLDRSLEDAVVEQTTDNESVTEGGPVVNTYSVFVPGALREQNTVDAADEAEAKAKVRKVLISKMEHIATKKPATGPNTELEVQNVKISTNAKNAGKPE